MATSLITPDDIDYLVKQSGGQMNMIIAGMTSLIQDNESKAKILENQTWFQRMCKTVSGKNKMTEAEIMQNHDRLNVYLSEALTELYNRNCIDHEIIISLGNQINEVYASQVQLKQMLGAFAYKLNEKIESVDNFHMLCSEIEQGLYSADAHIISICRVLSNLDKRSLTDSRKLDIIERALTKQGLISSDEADVNVYLEDVINLDESKVGLLYIELGNLKGNIVADLLTGVIENYHMLAPMTRKMIKKDSVINTVLNSFQIDDSVTLSLLEIYNGFVQTKVELVEKFEDVKCITAENNADKKEDVKENTVDSDTWIEILGMVSMLSGAIEGLCDNFISSVKSLSENVNTKKVEDLLAYRNGIVTITNVIYEDSEDALRTALRTVDDIILQMNEPLADYCHLEALNLEDSFSGVLDEIAEAVNNFDGMREMGVGMNSSIVNITELQISSFECQLVLAKQTLEEITEAITNLISNNL